MSEGIFALSNRIYSDPVRVGEADGRSPQRRMDQTRDRPERSGLIRKPSEISVPSLELFPGIPNNVSSLTRDLNLIWKQCAV